MEGLSLHIPVNYKSIEVNNSGTIIVATILNHYNKYELFVYNLQDDYHWYIQCGLPDYINRIHFLDDQNLIFLFEHKERISGDFDIEHGTKNSKYRFNDFVGIVSVASPNVQVQDYKYLGVCDQCASASNLTFIEKRHEGETFESVSNSNKLAITKSYYFGYQYYAGLIEGFITSLGEMKVTKHKRKLPISL